MENKGCFYCYSLRMYHFLVCFNEQCLASKVNSKSGKRYWIFNKSKRLDKIIESYNKMKHDFS